MLPKGAPGGSWALLQLGKNGRIFPAAQRSGGGAPSRAAMQISPLHLGLPACNSLAHPTHTAGACCIPQPCLRRGLRWNRISPLPPARITDHLDFKGSCFNWKLFLAVGKEGAPAWQTPPALSSRAARGDAGEAHPSRALGGVCTQLGSGASQGWSQSWVGGREGRGGCKLGEKVRHAINKWHPGKEMSV